MNVIRHFPISECQAERDLERIAALHAANEDYKRWEPYLIGAATAGLILVAWYATPVLFRALIGVLS